MKKTGVILAVLCLGFHFSTFCQGDEESIKKLLENETAAFSKMAFADVVKMYWVVDEKTVVMVTMPDGNHVYLKQEALLASTTQPTEETTTKIEKYDYHFSIADNTAFVAFSQKVITGDGDSVYSHECRFLKKVGTDWKLHSSSVHQYVPKGDRE